MKADVLVTGASGFVGTALVAQLQEAGHRVHGLMRERSPRTELAERGVLLHPGDLRDSSSVARAVAALDPQRPRWVAHCGALISYRTHDAARQRAVNVEGTRAVLEACRTQRVERLLHVSSVVTVGHTAAGEIADESWRYNGRELRCDYVDTKREAEELVLARADELDVVVVNPGAIFGPNPRGGNTARFLQRLADGRIGPLAAPGSLSVVGVEDVARGSLLALERGRRGRRYLLCESVFDALSLFQLGARLCGVRGPRRRAPRALWKLLTTCVGLSERLRPGELLTPQMLGMLGAHFRFDGARARSELGWRPEPFERVLEGTIAALGILGPR